MEPAASARQRRSAMLQRQVSSGMKGNRGKSGELRELSLRLARRWNSKTLDYIHQGH